MTDMEVCGTNVPGAGRPVEHGETGEECGRNLRSCRCCCGSPNKSEHYFAAGAGKLYPREGGEIGKNRLGEIGECIRRHRIDAARRTIAQIDKDGAKCLHFNGRLCQSDYVYCSTAERNQLPDKYGHIARECRSSRKDDAFCAVLSTFLSTKKKDWFIDSGASVHMTSHSEFLENVKPSNGTVVAANGNTMNVIGTGTTVLRPVCQEKSIPVHEVQLIPDLSVNLLSVNQIVKKGHTVVFSDAGCKVINGSGDIVAMGKHENDLFKFEQRQQDTGSALACPSAISLKMWHQRLGHLNLKSIRKLTNGLADRISIVDTNAGDCKVCPMGKHCRQPFSAEVLDVIHTDICGPMEVSSIGGSKEELQGVPHVS